jgi:DnaK suppressor protein
MSLAYAILLVQKALLVVSFSLYLFWTWRLGRVWGFHKEKILDLALITPAFGIVVFWLFFKLGWPSESVFLIGCFLFVYYFTRKEIWSFLKIGDIFAMSLSLASIAYPYYPSLLFNLFSIIGFYLLYTVSRAKPRSGFVFFTFLSALSVYILALSFWRYRTPLTLNSVLSLVGLTFGVISLKRKEYVMSMDLLKYSLPSDLLEKLRKSLLEKKKDLDDEKQNLVSEDTSLDSAVSVSAEEEDRALVDQERDRNDSSLQLIEESRKEVEGALEKINVGTYGLCEKCHKPIEKARLETYPETRLCLECAPKEVGMEDGGEVNP